MGGLIERGILVTGSGSGIGAAIVRRLARPGTAVLVHALTNQAGCDAVAAQARAAGAVAETMLADLSKPGAGAVLVEEAALVANWPDLRSKARSNSNWSVAASMRSLGIVPSDMARCR